MIAISQSGILVMLIPPLRFASQAHDVRSMVPARREVIAAR
jgi:hypothetical protein